MLNRLKLIVIGVILGVITWGCVYIVIETGALRQRFTNGEPQKPSFPGHVPPQVMATDPVMSVKVESLPDLYLQSVARIAIVQFDKGKLEDGMRIINLVLSPSERDDTLLAVIDELLISSNFSASSSESTPELDSPTEPSRLPTDASPSVRAEYAKKMEEDEKKIEEGEKKHKEHQHK